MLTVRVVFKLRVFSEQIQRRSPSTLILITLTRAALVQFCIWGLHCGSPGLGRRRITVSWAIMGALQSD